MPAFSMQKTELEQLLKLISLSGIVTDCELITSKNYVRSKGLDRQTAVFFSVKAKCKTKEDGKLQIPDIDRFQEILSRFSGTVQVSEAEGSGILLRGQDKRCFLRGTAEGELDSKRSLSEVRKLLDLKKRKFKKISFGRNFFVLTKDIAESLVRDISVISTGEYICRVILNPEKEYVLFVLVDRDTKNKFRVKVAVPELEAKEKVSTEFGYGLKEVLETTADDLRVFLSPKEGSPAWIESTQGFYVVQSEKEDEDEEE